MLPLIWTPRAQSDLLEIIRYIGEFNPGAAERLKTRLETVVLPLSEHPEMYRKSDRLPNCREIVAHPNYIVLYRVNRDCVEVMRIVHARRVYF